MKCLVSGLYTLVLGAHLFVAMITKPQRSEAERSKAALSEIAVTNHGSQNYQSFGQQYSAKSVPFVRQTIVVSVVRVTPAPNPVRVSTCGLRNAKLVSLEDE